MKDPAEGVEYFKNALRPHLLKGVESVFHMSMVQIAEMRLARPLKMDGTIASPQRASHIIMGGFLREIHQITETFKEHGKLNRLTNTFS